MATSIAAPPAALLTADEFAAHYADARAELVQGVVKKLPMPGQKHGKVCLEIGFRIRQFLETNDIGHATSNDSWVKVRSNPDIVRGSDVCFFSYDRLPKGGIPEGVLPAVPDLVVKVRSPSDRWKDVLVKVTEYLDAGVRVDVVLDPKTESATVYRPDELQQIVHNGDELTLPDVLPGFAVPVSRLFA
ncbi:MAG: Uma2 family endonuclease [Gemmataceae bacterium]